MAPTTSGAEGPAARAPVRVLVVGMGDRGGVGRFEELLAEALLERQEASRLTAAAVWRQPHPDYLRNGRLGSLRSVVARRRGRAALALAVYQELRRSPVDHVFYTHVNLARIAPALVAVGLHPREYAVWAHGAELWSRRSLAHRLALQRAHRVLAGSHFTADRVLDNQGVDARAMFVVPLTLPEARFDDPRAPVPREEGRVLTVARLDSTELGKGVASVIEAMPEVVRRVPGASLTVVGDGASRTELMQSAADLGIKEIVAFPGRVSDEALIAEYQRASVFVLPSDKEGFGLVFVEAMHEGTPVVALARGAAGEVVRDGVDGRLLTARSELAGVLADLLQDESLRGRMGDAARARVLGAFSPDAFRRNLAEALGWWT